MAADTDDDEAVVSVAALVKPAPPPPPPQAEKTRRPTSRPPAFRQCPICDREFGSKSLDIHLPACAEKHGVKNEAKVRGGGMTAGEKGEKSRKVGLS